MTLQIVLPSRPSGWKETEWGTAVIAMVEAVAEPVWPRERRNALLALSDWTQLADAPLTTPQKAAWAAYRVALRNLPESFPNPSLIEWPSPPA